MHDFTQQRRLVEVKNLEERRDVPVVLRNETLQKTDQQIGSAPASMKLIPVGHSVVGPRHGVCRNLKCDPNGIDGGGSPGKQYCQHVENIVNECRKVSKECHCATSS